MSSNREKFTSLDSQVLTPQLKQSFANVEAKLQDEELLLGFFRILVIFYPTVADDLTISRLLKEHTYPSSNYKSPRLAHTLHQKLIEIDSELAIVSEDGGYRLVHRSNW